MPCFVALVALLSPRLALFVMLLFRSNWLTGSMDGWLFPIIGFFLLPWTTLAYALSWGLGDGQVAGFAWFVVILAFLVDVGSVISGMRSRAARS